MVIRNMFENIKKGKCKVCNKIRLVNKENECFWCWDKLN